MRLDVATRDRVGITRDVLGVLAAGGRDVAQVEVVTHHVYLDVPDLAPDGLPALVPALRAVPGVEAVTPIELMPGERRRLQLDALLAALPDPVATLDGEGRILAANAGLATLLGTTPAALAGRDFAGVPDDSRAFAAIRDSGFAAPDREVQIGGRAYLLDIHATAAGAVVVLHAPTRLGRHLSALGAGGFEALLGRDEGFRRLLDQARRLARVDAPLLIRGETGTGKELVARACHDASGRRPAPFLALNCAALPESLAESELFGYAPGAFSGAERGGKPGLLELADRGTVFLDEIGEMSPYLQAKLLRFLEDGSFRRVGGRQELRVDVRIVSATHRDLEAMVADGRFREDLLYRLNVLGLTLPPLRRRPDDIALLARHFVDRAATQVGRRAPALTDAALAALAASPWPGNIRQLRNLLFRAVTLLEGDRLEAGDLDLQAVPQTIPTRVEDDGPANWAAAMAAAERALLAGLYPRYPSSRKLARRLGLSHTQIAAKLKAYGIGRG
jgi:TyrR family helix-turn-helix protein